MDAASDGCNTVRRRRAFGTRVGRDDGSLGKVRPSSRLLYFGAAIIQSASPQGRRDLGGIASAATFYNSLRNASFLLPGLQGGALRAPKKTREKETNGRLRRYYIRFATARSKKDPSSNIREF
ncbi:MAG TPA: hypothetical protein VHM88_09800 [Candidatus Acidoferrales bacterium]|nr:hypothetical protein [Candidatus Acidoferrales bacterium]